MARAFPPLPTLKLLLCCIGGMLQGKCILERAQLVDLQAGPGAAESPPNSNDRLGDGRPGPWAAVIPVGVVHSTGVIRPSAVAGTTVSLRVMQHLERARQAASESHFLPPGHSLFPALMAAREARAAAEEAGGAARDAVGAAVADEVLHGDVPPEVRASLPMAYFARPGPRRQAPSLENGMGRSAQARQEELDRHASEPLTWPPAPEGGPSNDPDQVAEAGPSQSADNGPG